MIRVGTSGWLYPHWRGPVYPEDLPRRRWLGYLASRLDAIEINTTFYGSARPHTYEQWREQVPEGFRFAIKGSRYVTHVKRLRDPDRPLANFFASGPLLLGAALGPILWQLPPQLPFDEDTVTRFLALLPRDVRAAQRLAESHDERLDAPGRSSRELGPGLLGDAPLAYAMEPRHPSFASPRFLAICREHGVAAVSAGTAGRHLELRETTAPLGYVRLHGSGVLYAGRYDDQEIAAWAERVCAWTRAGARDVYAFFDNDAEGHAFEDARRLRSKVGYPPRPCQPSV